MYCLRHSGLVENFPRNRNTVTQYQVIKQKYQFLMAVLSVFQKRKLSTFGNFLENDFWILPFGLPS